MLHLLFGAALATTPEVVYVANGVEDSKPLNQLIGETPGRASNKVVRVRGALVLDGDVRVPAGTRNLTIIGDGSQIRVKRATHVFSIGRVDFSVTKPEPAAGLAGISIEPAKAGDQIVTVNRRVSPGWHVIYDAKRVPHLKNPGLSLNYGAMLVQVTDVDGFAAKLDRPLNREYDDEPMLARVDHMLTEDVRIENFAVDGLYDPGKRGTGGFVVAGLAKGLIVKNMRARRIDSGVVKLGICRDFVIDGVHAVEPTGNPSAPGDAYGIYILRSSHGTIRNSSTSGYRHGFILHSGTTDVLVEDCSATAAGSADFDTHGMDERRITFRRCKGRTGFGLGNDAWPLGGFGHVIEDSDVENGVYIGPNVTNTIIRRSSFGTAASRYLLWFSATEGGMPGNIRFENCKFEGLHRLTVFQNRNVVGHLRFVDCEFSGGPDLYMLDFSRGAGKVTFERCAFRATDQRQAPVFIVSSKEPLDLSIRDSKFSSPSATRAIWVTKDFAGRLEARNNTFKSPKAERFLDAAPEAKVSGAANKASKG
ncbi:MAG TPA: right-handed parallel beta-helix repeat-containing protein [Fimbriimonadaceae bacterium]|nr:right-handed parallel beta-helix repeat-containing protein [Fimbriimonadaceae bacterium]